MTRTVLPWERIGLIAELAEKSPVTLGRTALMKFCYFLQALRRVPLGYDFTLYAYGPFDSAVLDDLAYAKIQDAATEKTIYYPNGYGYEIRPGGDVAGARENAAEFLERHREDVDWVVREFGRFSAGMLELASTMVYTDQEAARTGEQLTLSDLVRRVLEIKPRFSADTAVRTARQLQEKGLLRSVRE